jgi:GWxTD domain-containing protein
VVLLIIAMLIPFILPGQTMREKDLSPKYEEWLKSVSYIILQKEKDVFIQLESDRDRDIFVESFWKQRDPTPGTPQNEFKDEHIKRFNYANTYYRRGTPREGWMTDMGRIYIILGPPTSDERFEGTAGIHPCQVWYYYGDQTKGLPTYFAVVFYQRGGSGEFKLYNPTSDGPLSLLIDPKGIDVTDYRAQYAKIKEFAPTLANVAISLIPGQFPYNFQPSPQNNLILANIFESPKKNVSSSYATHFRNYKGYVSTEYMTNFVESGGRTALLSEPTLGIQFLHFSLTPKSVSVDYYEPKKQYFCNFKLDVSLRQGGATIFQYSKDFPFYFSGEHSENIRTNGLSLQDSFPVIEGKYALTVLLQNSVGKEFSVFEKDIVVPADTGPPQIVGPLVGYKLQNIPGSVHAPFQAFDKQIFIDPADTLGHQDQVAFLAHLVNVPRDLWKDGELSVAIKSLSKTGAAQKSLTIRLSSSPYSAMLPVAHALPAVELAPDYYELALNLKDAGGRILDTKTSNFVVSAEDAVPHPVTLAKSFPLANVFLYFYTLAYQYDKAGELQKAESYFEKALALKPDYLEGIVEYGHFLVNARKYDRAMELAERLRESDKLRFDYYLIRGRALAGREEYGEAITSFLEGNKIYNSDTRLLNALGFCFYKTRQRKEALDVLNASLRLDPGQSEVKDLIAKVEKELK